jgi:hypothetical protein
MIESPCDDVKQTAEKLFWHAKTSIVCRYDATGEHSHRMLKKTVQQGRSE